MILELRVRNHPGVMSHITGLFARRAFNLDSILCTPVGDGTESRLLLQVADTPRLAQVAVEPLFDIAPVLGARGLPAPLLYDARPAALRLRQVSFAAKRLVDAGCPARFVVVGEGSMRTEIERLAATRVGRFEQMPPSFSAKKIHGRPAHELARKQKPVELQPVEDLRV